MGNGIEENNLRKINPEEIIENDCYEEIDLNKINKIIEKEKCWNKNSIIVSLNEFDLKKLNEDNVNIEDKKEKDKNNDEVVNDVIEEQKNEEGSEDGKKNEIKENGQIVNNEINHRPQWRSFLLLGKRLRQNRGRYPGQLPWYPFPIHSQQSANIGKV